MSEVKEKIIKKFELKPAQKKIFSDYLKRAHEALLLKGEHRFLIAEIAVELHRRILGEAEPMSSPAAIHLRNMFAKDLVLSRKAIDVWIDVNNKVAAHVSETVLKTRSFTDLLDITRLVKKEGLSVPEALKEAIAIDEEKVKLAERDRLNRTRLLNAKTAIRDLRVEY